MFSATHQSADKAHNRKNCPDKNKIGCNFCFRRWICRALRDRQIQSPLATNFAAGKISSSAALASCGHLRPCKLPWMQVCFLGLQAFSTLCQSVDFVNILASPPPRRKRGRQSADKAHNRKNRPGKMEIRGDFCFRRWICRDLRGRQIQS